MEYPKIFINSKEERKRGMSMNEWSEYQTTKHK